MSVVKIDKAIAHLSRARETKGKGLQYGEEITAAFEIVRDLERPVGLGRQVEQVLAPAAEAHSRHLRKKKKAA